MAFLDLFRRASFSHGIHPPYHKEDTASVNIRRMPFADVLVLPLDQHIGKPARAIVQKGQEVARGELIAEADGFVSAPIRAPATGRIKGIRPDAHRKGSKSPGHSAGSLPRGHPGSTLG